MSQVNEIIEEINRLVEKIDAEKKWDDGEYLSRVVVKLAVLNSNLGEKVAEAERKADTAEAKLKVKREQIKKDVMEGKKGDKTTAAFAESVRQIETDHENKKYLLLKYTARLFSIKRIDTNNLIDAIRSRLSFIKMDREKSSLQT